MHYKFFWLSLVGGSVATTWLGYSLVNNYFQEWTRFTGPAHLDYGFWIKTLALVSWLMTAIFFMRDRNNLTRNR
ncbi:hypothetical protein [Spirosoma oryzicola]|uniref:hypothetical protein n=1 Tax=Spirosoma oryzicola TaxID=2898794 RepID=UPI001E50F0E8|nr:hypothetical protein [Spirosoma oryzicola]UHG94411.1 hypothetical protein LQ777_27195 [Spirosoma oryzicola]